MITGRLQAVFGWQVLVGQDANWRSLRNFPAQANGAEMMRLAVSLATERNVRVIAPVHDALLIEAPAESINTAVKVVEQAMAEASRVVLDGFTLRTSTTVIRHPARYHDKRGEAFWRLLLKSLEKVKGAGC
jgi:hypothetical protein